MKNNGNVAVRVMMAVLVFVLWLSGVQGKADTYAMTTVVVSLDYDTDIVEVEDFNGNVWAFTGCEDWQLMDVCALMMNDNNTTNIYDDTIVSVHYDGWLNKWFEKTRE